MIEGCQSLEGSCIFLQTLVGGLAIELLIDVRYDVRTVRVM
jgi:hypothetical protein